MVNAAGDACEPVLSADVVFDEQSGTIKPVAVLETARQSGVDSVTPQLFGRYTSQQCE